MSVSNMKILYLLGNCSKLINLLIDISGKTKCKKINITFAALPYSISQYMKLLYYDCKDYFEIQVHNRAKENCIAYPVQIVSEIIQLLNINN